MSISLFHRTTWEATEGILAHGFRNGEDGLVWFSRWDDAWGEQGRHLLQVVLDLSESELSGYAVQAEANEVWDDAADDFVPCEPHEVEKFQWHAIPAAVVNLRQVELTRIK